MLYYLNDLKQQQACHARQMDYSPGYLPALAAFMGVTMTPIAPSETEKLTENDILLVGAQRLETLPSCRLILLGSTLGKDPVYPARNKRIFARYRTARNQDLPLFVPLTSPQTAGTVLTKAYDENGLEHPALIAFDRGYEFCFDLAASVWFSGDGFVPDQPSDYFFIGRTPDLRPLPNGEASALPYNDLLLEELERLLHALGQPMLYRLPPTEEQSVPHAVISFSGDDDCSGCDLNTEAALTMESLGFPYHINAMPTRGEHFAFGRADLQFLEAHGCEVALHTDFTDGVPYTMESQLAQSRLFEDCFGRPALTNTNHCFIQGGTTAERLRWLEKAGIIADNCMLGEFDPTDINAFDLCGFGFGTSFPRYTCDDAEHYNQPISTMEIPINYYEPRVISETGQHQKLISYLDAAAESGRMAQFFIHPHYLCQKSRHYPAVIRALHTISSHCKQRQYRILFSTTNRLAAFWKARAQARITYNAHSITVTCETPTLLRLPQDFCNPSLTLDNISVSPRTVTVNGELLGLLPLPCGTHTVAI